MISKVIGSCASSVCMASLLAAQALGDHKPGLRREGLLPSTMGRSLSSDGAKTGSELHGQSGFSTALMGFTACRLGNRPVGSVDWAGRKVLAEVLS